MSRSYVDEKQKHWEKYIPELHWALRSGANVVTGYSPNVLVFGSELPLDGRNHLFDGKVPSAEASDRSAYLSMIQNRPELLNEVKECMQHAKVANAKCFNSRRRATTYEVGAKVWKRNQVLLNADEHFSAKLALRWVGPYRIKAKVENISYIGKTKGSEKRVLFT